ncbi:MAG: hypothetical protein AMS24_02380 [Chlamydiae bacterium SM23_39]|nr:MAG: hypothetical protein AMS24_02380 [Chlamydiae bacterium SM23_39]
MKSVTFFSIIYAILVLLGGVMSFWHGDQIFSLFEIFIGVSLFAILFFVKKKIVYILISILSFSLILFYGYFFYRYNDFFAGVMSMVSAFIIFSNISEFFKTT